MAVEEWLELMEFDGPPVAECKAEEAEAEEEAAFSADNQSSISRRDSAQSTRLLSSGVITYEGEERANVGPHERMS